MKKDIRSVSKPELKQLFIDNGYHAFRGNQVYEWLWSKGCHDFDQMTNLSLACRKMLQENFVINHIKVDQMQKSDDGTIKNAIQLHDGHVVESVLIPTYKRTTACVSSQVGCSLNCAFCATAQLKRMRNLKPDEIFDQVVAIDQESKQFFNRPLSNIVFMGMGEPLMNYKNVLKSVEKITADDALNMSPKRITLSTSGVPKMIKKLAEDQVKFNLALSLHSAIDEIRTSIMPFNQQFPLADIKEALIHWYEVTQKPVTYEYIVWKDINDDFKSVQALVDFCKVIPCKVNLIEYNPIDKDRFAQADDEAVAMYKNELENNQITVTLRHSRGKDIDAACGQLANKQ
jgi:23S rRNA (adenine2503-C2)-methyltransferase